MSNRDRRPWPSTRLGWHLWYARVFNRTNDPQAAHLSCWYLNLYLAFGD